MTNFTKTRLTDKGLALLAKTGVSVTVTKVKTGNGEYQTDADIGAMTELKSEKQEFQITSTQKKTDTTYAIKFVMSNKELAEDYLFTEIGIYASDPDEGEILYAVCYAENKDADMIRKYSGLYEFKAIIVLNIQVNAGGVVKVVEQGLYALAEDLEELREEVGDKVDKEEGKGLSHNDFTDADRKKLDGIDEEANKYTHPGYTTHGSGLYKISVDASGHVNGVTAVKKEDITKLGIPGQDTNTTYSAASQSAAGLMSAADKKKLDGVSEGANKTTIVNNQITTAFGYAIDARQLNKSVENSFAYEMDKSISAINNSLIWQQVSPKSLSTQVEWNVFRQRITTASSLCNLELNFTTKQIFSRGNNYELAILTGFIPNTQCNMLIFCDTNVVVVAIKSDKTITLRPLNMDIPANYQLSTQCIYTY